ncbi:hypothetical protein M426DRAFT_13873 [Hypoxylon sp. CI-4A]|nr:hypothetical protein M426DRAFT_13873 [Hypoxylon sp. CI-4A]
MADNRANDYRKAPPVPLKDDEMAKSPTCPAGLRTRPDVPRALPSGQPNSPARVRWPFLDSEDSEPESALTRSNAVRRRRNTDGEGKQKPKTNGSRLASAPRRSKTVLNRGNRGLTGNDAEATYHHFDPSRTGKQAQEPVVRRSRFQELFDLPVEPSTQRKKARPDLSTGVVRDSWIAGDDAALPVRTTTTYKKTPLTHKPVGSRSGGIPHTPGRTPVAYQPDGTLDLPFELAPRHSPPPYRGNPIQGDIPVRYREIPKSKPMDYDRMGSPPPLKGDPNAPDYPPRVPPRSWLELDRIGSPPPFRGDPSAPEGPFNDAPPRRSRGPRRTRTDLGRVGSPPPWTGDTSAPNEPVNNAPPTRPPPRPPAATDYQRPLMNEAAPVDVVDALRNEWQGIERVRVHTLPPERLKSRRGTSFFRRKSNK